MSYIQIELGGKLRGLKFNQLAIEIAAEYRAGDSSAVIGYAVVYGGLRGNSYVKREEPDYTFENVTDWLDEIPSELYADMMEKVFSVFNDTQLMKDRISAADKGKEDVEKKSLTTEELPLTT